MARITDYPSGTPGSSDEIPYWDAANSVTKKAAKSSLGFGTGDASTNTSSSVDSEIALFSSTTGKILKRATTTGIIKGTSGVISAATSGTDYAPGTAANATGIVKSTTTTGALTTAVAGDFPTLNQDTTGKSAKTDALNSATTVVNVSSATAPSSGQVLTATSSTAATWQAPAGGGGGGGMWTYVTGATFSGTGHITIGSLDGNTDKIYRVLVWAYFSAAVGGYDLAINNDVGTSHHTSEVHYGFNTTNTSVLSQAASLLNVTNSFGAANIMCMEFEIFCPTGQERILNGKYVGYRTGGSTYQVAGEFLGAWLDTSTNITSIVLRNAGGSSASATSFYKIYKISNP